MYAKAQIQAGPLNPELNIVVEMLLWAAHFLPSVPVWAQEAHMLWYVGKSVMAAQRFAQLRTKMPGTEETVLSTLQSEGWYAGMT